jgi:raffinose/stachyose/melibiose transport system substrate-binding protein
MRKLASLLLAAAMLFSMTPLASAQGQTEINMFISQPEYADAVRALIDAYKLVKPDVTINYETTQNDYPTLLKTKINAGECPDIFSTTSGKEIGVYLDYSYNFADQPAAAAMPDSVKSVMMSGSEVHGFALKSNYFGIVYNKAIFDACGITEFPSTVEAMQAACEKIAAAGYQPFSTGFAEWWVYKHIFQHFLDAASDNPEALVKKFIAGEAKFSDYPVLYDNFFGFIDLAVKYGDAKPLETDLAGEESAIGTGKAAMILGQGAWVEADILNIDSAFQIGFNGYPVTADAAKCQVIGGSDQALRIYKDSKVLSAVLDFVNWWYTSDYGKSWFCDVAGVIPPIKDAKVPDMAIIKQGSELSALKGAAAVSISYSTDSFHQAFGEIMQSYVGGVVTKDEACKQIEQKWVELEGGAK